MVRKYRRNNYDTDGNLIRLIDDDELERNFDELKRHFDERDAYNENDLMNRMLVIDNFDSFTYNLVQGFRSLGAKVNVIRNWKKNPDNFESFEELKPTHLVISPGPGRPIDAGVSIDLIKRFTGKIPILGVCLGHQCIIEAFGGKITYAKKLMHGKTSIIEHDKETIFESIKSPMTAGRYHSLAAEKTTLPNELEITATTTDGEIMAVRHKAHIIEGVQFHPESILTPDGEKLMRNFLHQKRD